MGFELFLARIECEHLIRITSQKSYAECLQIIQNLGSAAALQEESELDNAPNGGLEEDGAHRDNVLLNPEPSLKPLDLEVNKCQTPEHGSFLSDDKSILELQKDYPDLAFRQRPIFKRAPAKRSGGRDTKSGRESSGLRSAAPHAEAPEPSPEAHPSEEQQLRVGAASHALGSKRGDDATLTDLAEMMDKLELKEIPGEEPLKRPVEETSPCEKNETIPILCSPSHQSVCSVAGCGGCSAPERLQQHRSITEPPQSFYIPNRVSGSAAAPPAEHEENKHPCSRAGAELVLQHHNALQI